MIPRSQFIAAALSLTWLAGACSGTILEKPVFKGPIDRELAVTFADERIIGHTRNGPLSILSWDASGFPATEPQFKSPVGSAQPFSDRWGRVFTLTDYSRNLNLMRLDPYEVATTFEVPFGVQKESLRNMTSESHLCFHRTESEFINTPGGEPYEGAWVYHQFLDVLDLATGTRVSHPLGSDDSSQGLKSILTGRTICIQKARTYSSDASLETWDIVSGKRTASREIDLGFEIAHFAFADGIAALGKNVGVYDGHFLEPIHFVSIETGQTTTLEPPPLEANTTSHFDYRSSSILPTLNGFWIAYYREHTTIVRHVTLGGPGFYKIDFEGEVDYYNPSGLAAGLVAYDERRIAVTLEFWNLGSDPGRDIAIFDRGDRRPEVRFHAEDVRDGSAEALMRVTLDRFSPKGAISISRPGMAPPWPARTITRPRVPSPSPPAR